jgi:hypothetical protein
MIFSRIPLTRTQAQRSLFFVQHCHPGKGLIVSYEHASGQLVVICLICQALVARVLVAEDQPPGQERFAGPGDQPG